MSPFLAWVDFHARSRFARSTIPKEKWGTTRSLTQSNTGGLERFTNFKVNETRENYDAALHGYPGLFVTNPFLVC